MINDLTLYKAVRSHIQTGDLLLYAADSILGSLIRDFSHANVNHAAVAVRLSGITQDRMFVYESLSTGFGPHYLSTELEVYKGQVWWLKLKEPCDRGAIEERAFQYDGTEYDYQTLFACAITRPEKDTDKMICSEAADIVITGNTKGNVMSPGELPGLGIFEQPIRIL